MSCVGSKVRQVQVTFHRSRVDVTAPSINYEATQFLLDLEDHFVKRLGLGIILSVAWWLCPDLWKVTRILDPPRLLPCCPWMRVHCLICSGFLTSGVPQLLNDWTHIQPHTRVFLNTVSHEVFKHIVSDHVYLPSSLLGVWFLSGACFTKENTKTVNVNLLKIKGASE